jgi:phage baseplate assembly protein gpV
MSASKPLYGKFRGTVTDNQDPNMQGRITANVPGVLEDQTSSWAMPSVPYAGTASDNSSVGFFFIPPKGANVWIEFEDGDITRPIWSGCFWNENGAPTQDSSMNTKVLKTDKATITIDDSAGSVTIETPSTGFKIVMDSTGITLSCDPNTVQVSTSSVSVNNGALEVT